MPGKVISGFGTARRVPAAVIFLVMVLSLALCLALPQIASAGWITTGDPSTARAQHTAIMLPNGKVLVAGGGFQNCELYDPVTGLWTNTGPLTPVFGRAVATVTLLPNGKVLIVGGVNSNSSAELYDPATGSWSSAGNLAQGRYGHTATLLPNGKVLVVGGYHSDTASYLATAEIYTPDVGGGPGTWGTAASLTTTGRYRHTATLLSDGRVLVAGGFKGPEGELASAELYTPDDGAGSWSPAANLPNPRSNHTATLLANNGKVLVAGGGPGPLNSAVLYTPDAGGGSWNSTASFTTSRSSHTATLLPNGKVLLVAGRGVSNTYLDSAEIFTPSDVAPNYGSWAPAGSLSFAREDHTATLLPNGQVLVVAGLNAGGGVKKAELYDYAAGSWAHAEGLSATRVWHTATLMSDGQVMVAAGTVYTTPSNTMALYNPASWGVSAPWLNSAGWPGR